MHGSIYVLIDPRDHSVRYVGQTIKPVSKRLADHINTARPGSHVGHWLMLLKREGVRPIALPILAANDKLQLDALEVAVIAFLRGAGVRLTNKLAGGNGGAHMTPHTDEIRAKISASLTGKKRGPRPQSVKDKISAAQRGRKRPDFSGKKHPTFDDGVSADEIVRLWLEGKPKRWIARHLGTTQGIVQTRIATAGPFPDRVEDPAFYVRPEESDESKAKRSAALTGRKRTPEQIANHAGAKHHAFRDDVSVDAIVAGLSAGKSYKEIAAEMKIGEATARKRMHAAVAAGTHTIPKVKRELRPETRAKMERVWKKIGDLKRGKERTPEERAAIVAGRAAGKQSCWDDARRETFRAKMVGREHAPESIEKMRAAKLGTTHTPETIAKLRGPRPRTTGDKHHAYRALDMDAIRARLAAGEKPTAIARSLGVAPLTLRKRLASES